MSTPSPLVETAPRRGCCSWRKIAQKVVAPAIVLASAFIGLKTANVILERERAAAIAKVAPVTDNDMRNRPQEIESLQADLVARAQSELKAGSEALAAGTRLLDSARQENEALKKDLKARDDQLAKLQEEAEHARAENAALKMDLQARDKEISNLKAQNGTLQKSRDAAKKEAERERGEAVRARGENETLKRHLGEMRNDADAPPQDPQDSTPTDTSSKAKGLQDKINAIQKTNTDVTKVPTLKRCEKEECLFKGGVLFEYRGKTVHVRRCSKLDCEDGGWIYARKDDDQWRWYHPNLSNEERTVLEVTTKK